MRKRQYANELESWQAKKVKVKKGKVQRVNE